MRAAAFRYDRWIGAALLVLLALLPIILRSEFWLNFWSLTLLFALLGQAWNVLGGYGGQFSFGHALFFGTGAYAAAVLQVRHGLNAYVAALLAVGIGAAVGAAIGALVFRYRLRGSYFALVTLAFAEVFRVLATATEYTGGGAGLLIPLKVGAANLQFADKRISYLVAWALVAAGTGVALWLERSRFGARLVAVRENEAAAQALGIDIFRTKLGAITLSAALAAAAGVFYVQTFLFVDGAIGYGPGMSVQALLVPIVGGLGTAFGPLFGAAVLHALGEAAGRLTNGAPGLNLVFYGLLLIVMLRFLPDGIVGLLRLPQRRAKATEAAAFAKGRRHA